MSEEPDTKQTVGTPAGGPDLQAAARVVASAAADAERWRRWKPLCRACDAGHAATVAECADDLADDLADARADAGWALRYNGTLRRACTGGRLRVVEYLVAHFGLTADDVLPPGGDVFAAVCAAGHQAMAEWLADRFELTGAAAREGNNKALRDTCRRGHLGVAAWLADHFELTVIDAQARDNDALRGACVRDRLDVAQWLVARFGLTAADAQMALRRPRANATTAWLAGHFTAQE